LSNLLQGTALALWNDVLTEKEMRAMKVIKQAQYQGEQHGEHIWQWQDGGSHAYYLAGAVLGGEVLRMRCLRVVAGEQYDAQRYQLVDGAEGTLPYHSWIVVKGDEQWSQVALAGGTPALLALLEPLSQSFAYSETALYFTRALASKERIYGLGERTGDLNKRGQSFPIWNIDPPKHHTDATETMYTSIPFYIGFDQGTATAYGVLIDATSRVEMDMGKTNETEARISVQGDSLVVYFFTGPSPAHVMRQYTELTGHMPLPARWTLGYHQCRWGYVTQQQVLDVARRLREGRHASDALWLDIDYMRGYRNFTWNPETFPEPEQMLQTLHEQGFHLVTIVDPGTKIDDTYTVYQEGMRQDMFCRYPDGKLFEGSVWPGLCVFPDFSQQRVRAWWGNLYQPLLAQGVDGIWNDMDEPSLTNFSMHEAPLEELEEKTMNNAVIHRAGGNESMGPDGPTVTHEQFHNAYGMEMARASYEGLLRLRPNTRPFILTRSGTAGIQRYAAVWTGDNTSWWEHIGLAIRMCLNLGMSGVPFVGADIGGFWEPSNGELLVRFAQMGAFLPFCRNHNALGNPEQEPWAFGEPYESAYRRAIETRYALLPYLYTLFHEASVNGSPIIRPLYFHYPNDEQACDTQTAFLVGDSLLSAPVLEEGATRRSVYLPKGQWFDYWDGTEYTGGATSEIAAPLDRWPLLVRGNSILPSGPVLQYVDQQPTDPLTFTCYMATDGQASYTLYEDDGSTQAYRNGAYATTTISCRVLEDNVTVTVRIDEQHTGYQPVREAYELVVHVGNRTLLQRVKAGQGTVIVRV
jgi:alpha-glucosidase